MHVFLTRGRTEATLYKSALMNPPLSDVVFVEKQFPPNPFTRVMQSDRLLELQSGERPKRFTGCVWGKLQW